MRISSGARDVGLIAIAALLIMLPTLLLGPGDSHSVSYNYIWTSQFGSEMAKGNLYPRWLPDSFEGLGSPTFYFYPPLAYWIAGAFNASGLSTFAAINMAGLVAMLLSGLAMHRWLVARGTFPLLGAILYMAAPYHLMDFYVRGALAEFTAFIWYPLIALALLRLPDRKSVCLLAAAYGGLILTHLPMAMLTGFFLVAPLGLYRAMQDRRVFWPLVAGGVMAVSLAAFYLLPALTLQGQISSQLLWTSWYRPSSWGLLASDSLLKVLSIPALILGLGILSLPSRSVWTFLTILAGLAALGLIPFIWDMEPFSRAQFPWRLLGLIEFTAITALLNSRPGPIILGLGAALALFAYMKWVPQSVEYLLKPVPYSLIARDLPDAVEYLPAGFDARLIREYDRKPDLGAWHGVKAGAERKVDRPGEVTMRRAAFPIWRVVRDQTVIAYQGPVMHFRADRPGAYRIERVSLWQEWVGFLLSLAGLVLLALVRSGYDFTPRPDRPAFRKSR